MIVYPDSNNPQELVAVPGASLVACLNRMSAYIEQLKALIELSSRFAGVLTIYIIADGSLKKLKIGDSCEARILGTPTFLLLHNGSEQARLLGEANAEKLTRFLHNYQIAGSSAQKISGTLQCWPSDQQLPCLKPTAALG